MPTWIDLDSPGTSSLYICGNDLPEARPTLKTIGNTPSPGFLRWIKSVKIIWGQVFTSVGFLTLNFMWWTASCFLHHCLCPLRPQRRIHLCSLKNFLIKLVVIAMTTRAWSLKWAICWDRKTVGEKKKNIFFILSYIQKERYSLTG